MRPFWPGYAASAPPAVRATAATPSSTTARLIGVSLNEQQGQARGLCKELYPRLQATFEMAYETRFVILDSETCKPVNVNAVLKTYDAAEDVLKILGDDKNMIGHLLIER